MPHEESHYPRDWLSIAEKDWRRIGQALDDGDAEEAGFWLQQAVEKFLACKALREEGSQVVLVNSNPATFMTDPDMADVKLKL